MAPVVVVVGPPGSGKTTVGEALAQRLSVTFRDTDVDVERTAGKPVAEIFVDDGEPEFRNLERAAVHTALQEHDGVLALGGGAVLDESIRAALADHRVVYLSVGYATAFDRVGMGRSRPLLLVNPRAELRRLLDERRPLYESVATMTIDTEGRTPEQVVAEIAGVVATL